MIFLYVFLTLVLLSAAVGLGWGLRARRARGELAGVLDALERRAATAEEEGRRLAVELGRARSESDGLSLRHEEEVEARERLGHELELARAAESALRGEVAGLRAELAARATSLELARAVAREAEEVRDAQGGELTALRAALERAEESTALARASEERRRAERTALEEELAGLRSETVRVRREVDELRQASVRQAEAAALAARRLAEREGELVELSTRLERSASQVVAADERVHRLEAELEALRDGGEPGADVGVVVAPELSSRAPEEPRPRRGRVVVPVAGQGDLWAE